MASEYVTVTPTFTGMTYDELVKPLETMQTAYDTAEQGMYELGANADKWAKYAQQNPVLGARYNAYMSDLQNAAGDLMQTGNVRNAHSNMLKLYRRYQSDVQPIETCATAKSAAVTKMRDMQEKSGGTTIFEFDPSLVSLDEIYENPDLLDSNKSVNGKDIAERTKTIMENFAKADLGNMSGEQWNAFLYGMFGPQYFEAVINKGFSAQDVAKMISDGDTSLFGYISDLVLGPTGILNWRSVNGDRGSYNYQTAQKYVEQAFWSGMGEAQRLQVENKDYSILGRMALSGGAGGQNPNDQKPIYRAIEGIGAETKAEQKAREGAASDAAILSKFLSDNPDYNDTQIMRVATDEEFDALQRMWAANKYSKVTFNEDGSAYYPEIGTYSPERQDYIRKNGPKPGSMVYVSDEYKTIDNLIRRNNVDEDGREIPWDGSKHMLEQTLAELNYKAQNRAFNNSFQFETTQPQVIAQYITDAIQPLLVAGTNGKYKGEDIWTESYNKGMREKDKKADKDALGLLAECKNVRSVQYDPSRECFRFYVVDDEKEKAVCVRTKGLFKNTIIDPQRGTTLDDLCDMLNGIAKLPNPSEEDRAVFAKNLDVLMAAITNNALGLKTQGEPVTNSRVSAGYMNPEDYYGNDI